ncbi:MAG: thylakoid membrane photosystem I accumulation factor [Woronichinia naegeliana WA131]|uniref:Thylakoid membrane photosystem I accumulation factor n=1 Tax=Woronichinia naegeliana WA131 TaxID=2824559 RepID=A0A977PZZ5_9CYAN|nr:MAG: thylakoid membrane photosystem I accumulation factor [Woronichinia naegeliana WA131]
MKFTMNYPFLIAVRQFWIRLGLTLMLTLVLTLGLGFSQTAWASIDDDRLDGNIFVVYAGNGSLVPPRLNLTESFARKLPVILVYYLDDNSDCKQYAFIVSRLQEFYGRAASIVPVSVDSILPKSSYKKNEPGYYYQGVIPQTVILDQKGKMIFNGKGQIKFEVMDDILRDLFNLLPRSQSVQLKQKTFNEFNSELVEN